MKNFGITLIVLAIVVGVIVFINTSFVGSTNIIPTKADQTNNINSPVETITEGKIIYAESSGSATQIIENDNVGNKKIVYSDKDEKQKIWEIGTYLTKFNQLLVTLEQKQFALVPLSDSSKKEILTDNLGGQADFCISPDGTKLLYVSFSNAETDYGYSVNLVDKAGKNSQELYRANDKISQVSWPNDKIYFIKEKEDSSVLESMTPDGKTIKDLYETKLGIINYVVQNNILVVDGSEEANSSQIYRLDLAGKNKKLIYKNNKAAIGSPVSSPDQKKIAYLNLTLDAGNDNSPIYVLDLVTQKIKKIGDGIKILAWIP